MSTTTLQLTDAERLELALERIAQSFKSVGQDLDGELSASLAVALTVEDLAYAERLALSLSA
jgi:hypothetical protein